MILATSTHAGGDRQRRTRWALIFCAWTAVGLLFSTQQYVGYALRGNPLSWWRALMLELPLTWAWALATPVILWLGRRLPVDRSRWPRNLPVHLVICNAFICLTALGYAYNSMHILPWSEDMTPVMQRAAQLAVIWVFADGLVYWMIIGIGTFVENQRRLRERELMASQLETQLAQAHLQALKAQLHPHFLFNALHTIGSLVRSGDRDNAVRILSGLGDLLRRMLDDASQQEVPLEQELAFIRSYLDIERLRFRDRLTVAITADPAIDDVTVPHLILQPLVENAIRHGIARRPRAGHLTIAARIVDNRLHLVVRDDGPGLTDTNGDAMRTGIGLANTRARLTTLYGDDFEFQVVNSVSGGLEARIEMPVIRRPAERPAGR